MSKNITIYKITNLINQKSYIGRTIDFESRMYRHKTRAFNNNSKEYNYPLYLAIRKYGLDKFQFQKLLICSLDFAQYYENSLIIYYKSNHKNYGYNILDGNENIVSHNDIVRAKISKKLKEHYKKIPSKKIGSKLSKETKDKISKSRKGKCSKQLKIQLLKQNSIKAKKVVITSITNEIVGHYSSLNEAARTLDLDESCLSKVCQNKRFQHNGYKAYYN